MSTLEKLVRDLRKKKQEATRFRVKTTKKLKEIRSVERRSSSGLNTINKKINSQKEDASDVSETLNQKNAQIESIERLISAAQERLEREKQSLSQIEHELEFATPEEKESTTFRLQSLQDHISELENEIKTRQKMAKKITDDLSKFSDIKSKINQKIKKHNQIKPRLRESMTLGHKEAVKLEQELEQRIKMEDSAKRALDKASLRLQRAKSRAKPAT
ncbi:MAG: ATPase V, partial [Nitrosarchaeum sp.]|nr:ATPase V [Nitrosarchaeum sp.]